MKYMGALQRAQQATKSAHVFLSGAHAIKAAEVTAKQPRPAKVRATCTVQPAQAEKKGTPSHLLPPQSPNRGDVSRPL